MRVSSHLFALLRFALPFGVRSALAVGVAALLLIGPAPRAQAPDATDTTAAAPVAAPDGAGEAETPADTAAAPETADAEAGDAEADTAAARPPARDDQFPTPFWCAVFAVAFFGAVGGFAGDLAADGGKLARRKSDSDTVHMGWWGKLLIGAAAALIVLSLNPPVGWASLIGSALAAGIGGEALIQAILAGRRVQEAEQQRQVLREDMEALRAEAAERLDGVAARVREAVGDVQRGGVGAAVVATDDRNKAGAAARDAALTDLDRYVADAKGTLDRLANRDRRPPPTNG